MKKIGLFVAILFPIVVVGQTGQISIRVTDFDTDLVITNAQVSAGFNTALGRGEGAGGGGPTERRG